MSTTTIDVVMTVYNAEAFVEEAVQSILHQTFDDFRLICINDGSTDASLHILQKLAATDSRMEIISQENRGTVQAANRGLSLCTAPLIARMDADDIAMPARFMRQIEFLERHPKVLALGTAILEIDTDGDPLAKQFFPTQHEQLAKEMWHLKTPIANPSAMMRRQPVQDLGGYRDGFPWAEDLDLWLRLAELGRLANLEEVLLCYRQHPASICRSITQEGKRKALTLLTETFQQQGLVLSDKLIQRNLSCRSPAGPGKWARKAARQGQWKVARKHLRRQWEQAPVSFLTWRVTAEVAVRGLASRVTSENIEFPPIPNYRKAA